MPHVSIKLYPGQSEAVKRKMAKDISRTIVSATGCTKSAVSVSMEEVMPCDWADQVYKKEILEGPGTLFQEPGYDPFSDQDEAIAEPGGLKAHVREAAEAAAKADATGMFNPMSWMEQELEENPQRFDPFFFTPWETLSEDEKPERLKAVRAVL